jgi:hypothetical protein
MHRLAHGWIESKEELDALLKEFKAKGCDGRALRKLAAMNSLFNPSQYMEGEAIWRVPSGSIGSCCWLS